MTEVEEMSNGRDKNGSRNTGSTNNRVNEKRRNKNCEMSNMERETLRTHQFRRQQYCIHHKNDRAPCFDPVPVIKSTRSVRFRSVRLFATVSILSVCWLVGNFTSSTFFQHKQDRSRMLNRARTKTTERND